MKAIFKKADLSNRISKWAVELANFSIRFQPRTAIKAQVLADFIVEFSPRAETREDESEPAAASAAVKTFDPTKAWGLYVDGASNYNGARVGVLLISPE